MILNNTRTLKYISDCIDSATFGGLCQAEMLCLRGRGVLRRIMYKEGTNPCGVSPKSEKQESKK